MATEAPKPIASSSANSLTRLGEFEILEKIGEGGMGVVYRARQPSLARFVAIKVLTPQLSANMAYLDSFRREAQAAARLNHPNLIAVFDAGEADGFHYYAMEYVQGETLFRWVKREGQLTENTVVEIALCVASGLKHAWDKERLIHRDVKPENVIVDTQGNVKLCDLGLAKSSGENTLLSFHGQVYGTPQYMAPEHARGDKAMDARADIYSLGMTMYYAATGKIPFHGGTPAEVMARHLNTQLTDPREEAPELSANFCLVLHKMLARLPDDRYENWDIVLRDLHLIHDGKSPLCGVLPKAKSTLALQLTTAATSTPAAKEITLRPASRSPMIKAPGRPSVLIRLQQNASSIIIVLAGILIGLAIIAAALWLRSKSERRDGITTSKLIRGASYPKDFLEAASAQPLGGVVRTFQGHSATIRATAFSPNGRFVASGSADGQIKIWNLGTGEEAYSLVGHEGAITSVAFSPDARYLLSGGVDAILRLWEISTGSLVREFRGHQGFVRAAIFGGDGTRVFSSSGDGMVKTWDVSSGVEIQSVEVGDVPGQRWARELGTWRRQIPSFLSEITSAFNVAFSPDQSAIAIAGWDGSLKIWSLRTGQQIRALTPRGGGAVLSIVFTPNGRSLLSSSEDGRARLWDWASGELVTTYDGHRSRAPSVAVSPDGRFVATGSEDKTARVWDIATGNEWLILEGHTGSVRSVTFGPDGRFLLSGSSDRTVKVWKISQ